MNEERVKMDMDDWKLRVIIQLSGSWDRKGGDMDEEGLCISMAAGPLLSSSKLLELSSSLL